MTEPLVSVIMATWGRGRHILPSVQSVLRQGFRDFELIVAGDACTDETEAVVAGIDDPRVRWINLTERCGSQAAPNNAGIAAARGQIIAYLGHDDIWEPAHLALVAKGFAGPDAPDFVVSGAISYMPEGVPGSIVRGLFAEDAAKHRHFFPPSSFAHRRDVSGRIGAWRMPLEVRAPVDDDFLMRAAAADLRFLSTGAVTVHKFTSAYRYLSYVRQSSIEQEAMLARMSMPGHAEQVAAVVREAQRLGTYLRPDARDYDRHGPGDLARMNAAKRGLLRPKLQPLGAGTVIRQRVENCAWDWRGRPLLGIRLHTLNPRPRLLLPFAAPGPVALTMRVVHPDRAAFGPLELACNDNPVTARPTGLRRSLWGWTARYRVVLRLLPDQPSVLTFHLSPEQRGQTILGPVRLGFGIGRMRLAPIKGA
jgi:glycosyltransferase involved in cell wall biosynthesis